MKGDSAWTQIEDFWNFWKLLSSFFSVIFWCNTEEQTQLQCLKCPVGNLRCLRFLLWALMLCSYISISLPLLGREDEGKKEKNWGLFSFSRFFFDGWLWWVESSAGSVDFSLSLVLQRVPNQHPWDLLRWEAWKHWRNGIWKRTFVLLLSKVAQSSNLGLNPELKCWPCTGFAMCSVLISFPALATLSVRIPFLRKEGK